ncbi:hypothetical protein [Glaciimonas sp. PAMC28666]|uniref:hypothetical protein n=1 Tax=Glaciimonas sp. PAMC28666 TaxID=2807626 RepID=UPI001963F40F|nr:hypothetical protein [Glaciimonas sp. PAMC28666]QRX85145.1 hypothetical protein JQN73_04045 [Glaciimonas sp. PAMC28666]
MSALHIRDLVTAIDATAARFARLVANTGGQFALELAARLQLDGVVDGLVGHGIAEPKAPEFVRNLLW